MVTPGRPLRGERGMPARGVAFADVADPIAVLAAARFEVIPRPWEEGGAGLLRREGREVRSA